MKRPLADTPDESLLRDYCSGQDGAEEAFEELVRRHGAMVDRTCARILGASPLAEDAAQSAFVVLARRAREVRGPAGPWLHRVALNCARQALRSEQLRRAKEKEAAMGTSGSAGADDPAWRDLAPQLDAALDDLSSGQRAALVLHFFEGKSHEEAARALGVSRITVTTQINRGLERLRSVLAQRGVVLSTGGLAALAAANCAPAAAPSYLLTSVSALLSGGAAGPGPQVAAIAKGVIEMMFWTKVKHVAAALAAVLILACAVPAAVLAVRAGETAPPPKPAGEAQPPDKPVGPQSPDLKVRALPAGFAVSGARRPACLTVLAKEDLKRLPIGPMAVSLAPGAAEKARQDLLDGIAGQVDFAKEMVVGVFLGVTGGKQSCDVKKISAVGGVLRVEVESAKEGGGGMDTLPVADHPFALVACSRSELPVELHLNGAKLALVADEALASFLDVVRGLNNRELGVATVSAVGSKSVAQKPGQPATLTADYKLEWGTMFRGQAPQTASVRVVTYGAATPAGKWSEPKAYAQGQKLVVGISNQLGVNLATGVALPWSAEREKAVAAALK